MYKSPLRTGILFCMMLDALCYLADLAVKAGMRALSVNIDQLFIDIFYHFQHSSKRKQEFFIYGPLFMHLILRIF